MASRSLTDTRTPYGLYNRFSKMEGNGFNGRLKYFSRIVNNEGVFNILLVSTCQSFLDTLAQSLYLIREVQKDKRNYNLKVHTCKTILDVIKYMPVDFSVDFIVFIIDPRNANCLNEVESNVALLDFSFNREKICLVNPYASYLSAAVHPADIWDFAMKQQYNLIVGQILDDEKKINITKRILNVAEKCCGILNGIPMVDIV